MAVSATKLVNRDIYEITYDASAIEGDLITATFENDADGDTSTYKGANDGKFVVTVSTGYKGSDTVTVTGSVGGSDSGEITFG